MITEIRKKIYIIIAFICVIVPAFGQERSFDTLFPAISQKARADIFSADGLIVTTEIPKGATVNSLTLTPSPALGINLSGPVLELQPAFLVESLLVVPYTNGHRNLVQIYNAVQRIRDLKGRKYHSFTRNADVDLFEDASRIKSEKSTAQISDPPAVSSVPQAETIYLCLKDSNFGNTYYRADTAKTQQGLRMGLVNFKNINYILFPVMKKDNFVVQLYFEPLAEGVLVYSIAGVSVSDFAASKVDMPSAISKRLAVIIGWVADGIRQGG
jgi:hypothetical protein